MTIIQILIKSIVCK